MDRNDGNRTLLLALIPLGIALNLTIGTLVNVIKVPVYLDAIGTIVVAILAGPMPAIATGVGSFLLGGVLTNPVLPWFSGTQAAIGLYAAFAAKRGWFRTMPTTIATGIGLGVIAGVASAPVIVYLFGGITGSGASLVVAFLLASGKGLLNSVLLSGLAAEPIDKTLQCLLAIWLLKGLPNGLLVRFDVTTLAKNGIIRRERAPVPEIV